MLQQDGTRAKRVGDILCATRSDGTADSWSLSRDNLDASCRAESVAQAVALTAGCAFRLNGGEVLVCAPNQSPVKLELGSKCEGIFSNGGLGAVPSWRAPPLAMAARGPPTSRERRRP
jgi:hypothetical protein